MLQCLSQQAFAFLTRLYLTASGFRRVSVDPKTLNPKPYAVKPLKSQTSNPKPQNPTP